MRRAITVGLCFALCAAMADDSTAERRKAELLVKADKLFGKRYTPPAGKPLRLYDPQTETGPPDEVIYSHAPNYVIRMIFSADGNIGNLQLVPEALLPSNNWTNVPTDAVLRRAEMQSFVDAATHLQTLGKLISGTQPPGGCFQSGRNVYCRDTYEHASVTHFHNLEREEAGPVLRDISILYKRSVVGVVEDVKIEGTQRLLKVRGQWYRGETPGVPPFSTANNGSAVSLTSYGCTANEKVCVASPDEPRPR